jgi:hypothetical protein
MCRHKPCRLRVPHNSRSRCTPAQKILVYNHCCGVTIKTQYRGETRQQASINGESPTTYQPPYVQFPKPEQCRPLGPMGHREASEQGTQPPKPIRDTEPVGHAAQVEDPSVCADDMGRQRAHEGSPLTGSETPRLPFKHGMHADELLGIAVPTGQYLSQHRKTNTTSMRMA